MDGGMIGLALLEIGKEGALIVKPSCSIHKTHNVYYGKLWALPEAPIFLPYCQVGRARLRWYAIVE